MHFICLYLGSAASKTAPELEVVFVNRMVFHHYCSLVQSKINILLIIFRNDLQVLKKTLHYSLYRRRDGLVQKKRNIKNNLKVYNKKLFNR